MSLTCFEFRDLGEVLRKMPNDDLRILAKALGAKVELPDKLYNPENRQTVSNIVGRLNELLDKEVHYAQLYQAVQVIRGAR